MAQVSIKLEGMAEVQELFRRFPDHANDALRDIVAKTAYSSQQRMTAGAAQDTGRLRAAISYRTRGMSGFVEVKDAYYWRFVEYGTRFKAARPFIRPAREIEAQAMAERIRRFGQQMSRDFSAGRLL